MLYTKQAFTSKTPHLCSFYAKPERKSMKCHDFSDLNQMTLKWHLRSNGKL